LIDHLDAGQRSLSQLVTAGLEEMRARGHVEGQGVCPARLQSPPRARTSSHLPASAPRREGRRQSAFIGPEQTHPVLTRAKFGRALIHREHHRQRLIDRPGRSRHDEDVLDRRLASGMFAPAEQIDGWARQADGTVPSLGQRRIKRGIARCAAAARAKASETP
jgi:hypothetical protein